MLRLILPDLLERIRKQSFLGVLAAALYLAYSIFNGNVHMQFVDHRGVYDSVFIGLMVGMTTALLGTIVGFYIVKSSIERDRKTRLGEILAATPLGKFAYLLAKWLSNLAVLSVILIVQAVAAVIFVLFKAEVPGISWWPLLSPFLLIALPALSFTAALAVLFECVPVLRGGWGNVLYFFLWTALLAVPINEADPVLDWCGIASVAVHTEPVIQKTDPTYTKGFSFNVGPREDNAKLKPVVFPAFEWNFRQIELRLVWIVASLVAVLLASLFFDRFDRSRQLLPGRRRPRELEIAVAPEGGAIAGPKKKLTECLAAFSPAALLGLVQLNSRFGTMLLAELRLMLKGVNVWMTAVSLGLFIACIAAPLEVVRQYLLPVAWLVPLLAWSSMGLREKKFGVEQIVFSSPDVMRAQLPALWLAGVVIALLTGGGAIIHYVLAGDWAILGGALAGAVFIPALALGLGVWSGTAIFFEGVYAALWYIGPLNQVPALDFTGATQRGVASGVPLIFLLLGAFFLVLAFVGRKRQALL